ncbi:hypothetical protein AALP_AA2G202400 [Arabis alpina]|uniref:Uncharacterized protein n=1 Tax=Arabis alpina TaxID=50452 RepID=A0A087HIS3_ARAAL|nr:hypothetical protein AALP_AA2G202400 [Arabis alpina]
MSTVLILRNKPSGQNLVESTKLERIDYDSKTARRKEKKEKKERRKLKKEKHEKSHKHSSRKLDNSSKNVSDESELLEKSGLTEELEEAQNQLGYLSDGSQNSKKRRRVDSPPAVQSLVKVAATPVAGNPLRIRLVFKKKEAVPTLPQENLCSTLVAPKEAVPTLPQQDLVCSTSVAKPLDVIVNSVSCSKVSEPEANLPSTSAAALVETKSRKKHKPSKEERYNALFDGWTPPSIGFGGDFSLKDDDESWLFGKKTQEKVNPKAGIKTGEDMTMSLCRAGGESSWPKAQFLSEVGIYSLPYSVPF